MSDDVEVTFVGSGDAFGNGGRAQTCISLRTLELHALIDCGSTSLTALKHQGVDPSTVDLVAVTHLHADHFGGLPFLVLDGQFTRRARPLRVLGPPGIRERLRDAMEVCFPGSSTVERKFAVDVEELVPDGTPWSEDRVTVQGWEVDHASGAPPLCLRLQAGDRVVAYSGDTAWTDALTLAATDADLFAVEAYTYDKPVRYHLDYRSLCDHARQLPAKHTVLTHMSPAMLARIADAEHPTAYDGMTVTL